MPLPLPASSRRYDDLPRNVLDFCALLRLQGFAVGPEETVAALRALESVDVGAYRQFRDALQLVLCSSHEQEEAFDLLFRAFFLHPARRGAPPEAQAKATSGPGGDAGEDAPQQGRRAAAPAEQEGPEEAGGSADVADADDDAPGGSGTPTLQALFGRLGRRRVEPLEIPQTHMVEMLAVAERLVRRLRLGRSRRWRAMTRGSRYHFRRSLRRGLQTGGETFNPAWLGHPLRKPRFVFLLDGSRSMAPYSELLLQFAQALSLRSSRVEVFLFSTELRRVTRMLKGAGAGAKAPRLDDLGEAWGGGTRIGGCLAEFVRRYGLGALTRDTLVIIASDGLDSGNGAALERAMRDIRRRSAGVVWLNPLLETAGYRPTAAGMRAALPFVDLFASAGTAAQLSDVGRRIRLRR